jgi:prepilin-type N-terminal cleavage/methylation domain-containing protein
MRRAPRRRPQAGFTLIEILFVCAIVAILAAIAIPAFTEETRKGKSNAEVVAFFAEIAMRQEQYRVDNSTYFQPGTNPCLATTSTTGQAFTCGNAGQPWELLKFAAPTTQALCRYTITAGSGTGATPPTGFTFVSPLGPWWHARAECDMDGDGTMAEFFTSSANSQIQKLNESE